MLLLLQHHILISTVAALPHGETSTAVVRLENFFPKQPRVEQAEDQFGSPAQVHGGSMIA